ncbi:hypothetical protein [Halomonas sp. HAL1]|uniref:hypothetical protein n=1 Tax=Halomonas sp. HAL1 TaxID=550984 RepID=UPI00022D2C2C|nr:hypothetical protein [Halomonas sp. HAL1]EHA17146.1 hypothetical protein HAL1_03092 [Halomonas sp. HAL1]WKV92871.1 hypothetical protein Q3Y66_18825 [Halomonas sp. HAL1]
MEKTYSTVEKLQVLRKIIAYELSKDEKGFFVYLTTYSRFKPIAEIHLYKDIEKPLDILNEHIDNDGIDERDVKAYFREHFENQLSYLKDKETLKVIK